MSDDTEECLRLSAPRLSQSLSHIEAPAKQSHRGGCRCGTLVIYYLHLDGSLTEVMSSECASQIHKHSCLKRSMESSHNEVHVIHLKLTIKSHDTDSSLLIFPYTYPTSL